MHNPQIGVASLVLHDNRLLLGPRRKLPEIGSWQLPGGFMIKGESVFQAAVRLAEKKAGVAIYPLQQGPFTNNVFPDESHTVSVYVLAELLPGQKPVSEWQWFNMNKLPQPLFLPLKLLFDQHTDWLKSVGVLK